MKRNFLKSGILLIFFAVLILTEFVSVGVLANTPPYFNGGYKSVLNKGAALTCEFVFASHNSVISIKDSSQKTLSNSDMEEFYHRIGDFGIEIKATDETPSLSENEAIEIAKKDAEPRIRNKKVESIMAIYVKLTDRPGGRNNPALILPGTNIIMEDIPVWIVTFHGADILYVGPGLMVNSKGEHAAPTVDPYVYGDLNIVIDANTGNVLESFSYSIPTL